MKKARKFQALRRSQTGLTLIEMMVTMAVAIVLMSIGIPLYQGLVANNRAVTQSNALVSALQTARAEAVSRMAIVAVCARDDDDECSGTTDWENGWLVFVDDGSALTNPIPPERMIRVFGALPDGSNVAADANASSVLRFGPSGTVDPDENFELSVDGSKGNQMRCVRINGQGQVRLEKNTSGC